MKFRCHNSVDNVIWKLCLCNSAQKGISPEVPLLQPHIEGSVFAKLHNSTLVVCNGEILRPQLCSEGNVFTKFRNSPVMGNIFMKFGFHNSGDNVIGKLRLSNSAQKEVSPKAPFLQSHP